MNNLEQRRKMLDEIEVIKSRTKIDGDPTQNGLSFNYARASAIDGYRIRIGSILSEAISDVAEMDKIVSDVKQSYETKKRQEMNKDQIKILKSADQRNAAVDLMLARDLELINNAEKDRIDSQAFYDRVRVAHDDIRRSKETMDLQMDIHGAMRGIGEVHNISPDQKTRLVP